MRSSLVLAALLSVASLSLTGCCTTCGSASNWCSSNKCSVASKQTPTTATGTVAAKPMMPVNQEIVPTKHEAFTAPTDDNMRPGVPDHQAVMPEGEPSAMAVPPPPPIANYGEPKSTLPSPRQIASQPQLKARSAGDEWMEASNSDGDAAMPEEAESLTPRQAIPSTVGLSN